MSSEVAIKVENVSKCYQIYDTPRARLKQFVLPRLRHAIGLSRPQYFREFWALRDVSFEVKKGETVGIIGRNGSGKSTLLQMICGTLNPTSGSIEAHGRISALLELGSGFNPEFTGRENVYMNAAILGVGKDEIDARFDDIAAFADIGDFIEQPVKSYSSGMLVRLAFAVAINVEPEILIVDEALSVGDELFQRKCFSRIEALRARGATVFFVSHSASQIVELCDRAVLMDEGKCLAIGVPKIIVGAYQKLLYAPVDARRELREKIERGEMAGGDNGIAEHAASFAGDGQANAPEQDHLKETLDAHLKPSSTIEYESHGARIQDAEIATLEGTPVNTLIAGRTYIFRYRAVFDAAVRQVRFGMLIKTVSGVELGGGASAASERTSLPYTQQGSVYHVEFSFRCALAPGVYFLNAGIVGNSGGGETYLHRVVDAAMFRVRADGERLATGIVDFDCRPRVFARPDGV